MIRQVAPSQSAARSAYRRVFIILPRTVTDRRTDRRVRVWGFGMLRRWSRSDRAWHYRSADVA